MAATAPKGVARASSPVAYEEIQFNEANGKDGFALRSEVTQLRINPSGDSQMNDSSPFHFNTVVDYSWDSHYTFGRLIATHLQAKFIAYVVKVTNVGAVRVIDMDTKERVLMKGDKGLIKDVDFIHKLDDIIIGFIDEYGTFYINRIIKESKTGKLSANPIVKVTMEGSPVRMEHRRFIWCKYVPDELKEVTTPKDCAYHFAVLQNDVIYAGNLVQMVQRYGEGSHYFNEIADEFLTIDTHSSAVTDASFAPDGTALATSSKDGTVKFFQIYFQEKSPARCLYSWAPHDGRPVDKIFFLDNHTIQECPADSQYWKFMITASENMTELKLFTCKSWQCLQTLKFCSPSPSQWKVEIDVTAQYLVATDIHRKALYMIHLEHDDTNARFHWVREFSMPWNIISFNISSALALKPHEITTRGFSQSIVGDQSSYGRDDVLNFLEINVVQPRSLQQGSVAIKSPDTYSRSNGHHRISFNNDVSYKETKGIEGPIQADDEDEDEGVEIEIVLKSEHNLNTSKSNMALLSGAGPRKTGSGSLEREKPETSPSANSLNLNSVNSRSSSAFSPHSGPKDPTPSAPSVAQMSIQLGSLIGVSPIGRTSAIRTSISPTRSISKSASPHRMIAPLNLEDLGEHIIQANGGSVNRTSASSSPSREVEEILSPRNSEKLLVGLGATANLEETIVMNAGVMLDPFENGNLAAVMQHPKAEINIPMKINPLHSTDMGPHVPLVLDKVDSLMNMMSAQANEIKELKKEVSRLTVMQGASLQKVDDHSVVSQLMDKHFKQNQGQLNRLEEVLRSMDSADRHRAAQPTNSIPSNLAEVLAVSIGSVVKKEIESLLPQALGNLFDPARLNVNTQIERLTSIVEAKLTQNISQIMQREKIWQGLTANFQSITKSVFDSTFNDIFLNSVFPRCQSAVHEMLTQVNETFLKGTREYLTGLEDVLERERKREDFQDLIRDQINVMQDALSSSLQVEVESQMLRVLGGLQGGVVRQIEESMSRELSRAFKDQQRYFEISVIPRTLTPAISVSGSIGEQGGQTDPATVQRNLLALAQRGDIFNAFVQASNHGDVNVLMHLCRNFNPAKVFAVKLPSHVHVSIMHLLALDILEDTEAKINYLNSGLGTLDMSDRKTLKSVARMIPVFQAAVSKYVERNPESKFITTIKLLEMAFHGIGLQLKSPSTPSQSLSQHSFSQYQ